MQTKVLAKAQRRKEKCVDGLRPNAFVILTRSEESVRVFCNDWTDSSFQSEWQGYSCKLLIINYQLSTVNYFSHPVILKHFHRCENEEMSWKLQTLRGRCRAVDKALIQSRFWFICLLKMVAMCNCCKVVAPKIFCNCCLRHLSVVIYIHGIYFVNYWDYCLVIRFKETRSFLLFTFAPRWIWFSWHVLQIHHGYNVFQ